MEGEHSPTPKVGSPLLLAPDSEQLVSRGYAEGQREDGEVILSPPTPLVHQLPDGDDYSNGDCNFEGMKVCATRQFLLLDFFIRLL